MVLLSAPANKPFRQRYCKAVNCGRLFFICSHCDRGQRYCSVACRQQARLRQRRLANRRHQQSLEGRLDHRDRQQRYRARRCRARVTDQGSLSSACSASSDCGAVEAISPSAAPRSRAALLPLWPDHPLEVRLCCRVCGRTGRFIDQFPPIPRRR